MASEHFGNLRDVWSLLSLGEALRQERPALFAQSHAGCAFEPWDTDPERAAAAGRFARAAAASVSLSSTAYGRLAARELLARGDAARHPGVAPLALVLLGGLGAQFRFHGADETAHASILAAADELGVTHECVEIVEGSVLRGVGPEAFVLLDPLDALERDADGLDAWDTFERLAVAGARVLLVAPHHANRSHVATRASVLERAHAAVSVEPARRWCGEVHASSSPPAERSVHGCALVAANLGPATLATLRELGIRLAHALSTNPTRDGALGELVYADF